MRQYSSEQVDISWLGLDFREGLASGSFISEARNSPTWTQKAQGPSGKTVRIQSPDRSGTLSIVVDQESALHRALRTIARADRTSRDKVGSLILSDTSSGDQYTYSNAFITTEPDESRGTESATFTWVFAFENLSRNDNESPSNLVGQ